MTRYCATLTCWDHGTACKCARYFCAKCLANHECKALPHGLVLGEVGGVTSHNCHYDDIQGEYDHLNYVRSRRGSLVYTGDKWQCVEFVRRWWLTKFDLYLPDVPRACDIWDHNRNFVKRLSDGARIDLQKFPNGKSPVAPAVDDILLWDRCEEQPAGHTAIIVEVTDRSIRVAEQNAHNHTKWQGAWSREFPLVFNQGVYSIIDEDTVLGWVRVDHNGVFPKNPWKAPDEDRTSVDGDYGQGTITCLQKFLGVRADGQHGRFTDFALAAFLNTHLPEYPHVAMAAYGKEMDRKPLIQKLQAFLVAHPLISGAGTEGVEIKESGEWDSGTIKGLQNLLNRVNLADEFKSAAAIYKSGGGPPPRPNLPHGILLGNPHDGIPAYNCNYPNMQPPAEGEPAFDMLNYVRDSRGNLQYSGMKWQCVEYARRWWLSKFDVTLENVPRACDIWRRKSVKRLSDGAEVALKMFATGESTEPPRVGDLIIWVKTDEQPVGHVAVVCEVSDTHVRIGEQNVNNNIKWEGGFSREFPLQKNPLTGAWTMRDDEDPLFGWVRVFPDQPVDTPPWAPIKPRLPVDGKYEGETVTAWQQFVGIDLKRDLGDVDFTQGRWAMMLVRMTDYACAAFLNVAHQTYPHVPMESFMNHVRGPIVKKLQNFLTAHPELSGVGTDGLTIQENGEWDAPTVMALQNMLNKVDHYEDLDAAIAVLRK